MSARPLPIFIDAQDFHGNPRAWTEISRVEAHRFQSQGLLVAVLGAHGEVTRFDERSPFWLATGPYNYSSLRYFVSFPAPGPGSTSRPVASSRKPAPAPVEPEPDLVPLEEPEPEAKPAQRAAAPPAAKAKEPDKKELRFDLALDPATPGLEDDVFVLSSGEGTYNVSKTVRDDKVPGDRKLTLVFPGVEEGKAYTLSQVQDGEETVLVPEVTYAPAKGAAGPGEVVGCKAVFRECRILGESFDLTKPEDPRFPFELEYAKDKWIYVFGGPSGGTVSLLAEGRGNAEGGFFPVDLKKHGGKNLRPYISKASQWITLPLKVNGKEWDLYACLSPIQLPWKRIGMLEKSPQRRCYRIGEPTGGACWVPGHIGREVPKLSKARDSRIADPGKDIVMIGLIDHMAEAKRRAKIYQRELKPYLENRFDTSIDKKSISKEQLARRRKKHIAGLIKVLLIQHPQAPKLAECLAINGGQLDQYLREENQRELMLKKRFNSSAKALVKWMDAPERVFEEVLIDYMSDPQEAQLWELIETELAFLTAYFEVSALTRRFGKQLVERKDSWVHKWLLNPERFPAIREPTHATAEILHWLSGVVFHSDSVEVNRLTTIFSAWIKDPKFRMVPISAISSEKAKIESKSMEWFPDESKLSLGKRRASYLHSLAGPGLKFETKIVQISLSSQSMRDLKILPDSKVFGAILAGFELNNAFMALRAYRQEDSTNNLVGLAGAGADALSVSLELAVNAGANIGRGFLGALAAGCAICDFYSALVGAEKAAEEGDYDQIAAQLAIATGSASMAVGAAMISTSAYAAAAAGGNLITAGAGLSMTGAGSIPGAVLFILGSVVFAGATIYSAMQINDDLEMWLEECPFGKTPSWSVGDLIAPTKIAILFEMLHPFRFDLKHEFINRPGRYTLSIHGPLTEFSKISIQSLELVVGEKESLVVLTNEVLKESSGTGFEIMTQAGKLPTVRLSISDEMCWQKHKKTYPGFDNRFKYARIFLKIDLYDDRELVFPSRAVRRPIVLPIT